MTMPNLTRNKEILFRYRNGETFATLAKEYGLSDTRIRQITHQERINRNTKPIFIPEIEQACKYFNASTGMYFRILNALHEERLDIRNRWKRLPRYRMLSIRNLGEKAADILEYAQQIAR